MSTEGHTSATLNGITWHFADCPSCFGRGRRPWTLHDCRTCRGFGKLRTSTERVAPVRNGAKYTAR